MYSECSWFVCWWITEHFYPAIVYGAGSYFARDASFSVTYATPNASDERFMLLTRVIAGEFTVGSSDMKDAPTKLDGQQYDSVVNNTDDPSIFVVFGDVAAYPHYVIKFKLWVRCLQFFPHDLQNLSTFKKISCCLILPLNLLEYWPQLCLLIKDGLEAPHFILKFSPIFASYNIVSLPFV